MKARRVFISYSSKDLEVAEAVQAGLTNEGLDVWRDKSRLETDWSREIASALAKSDTLCLIWSADSSESSWVQHEWLTTRALEKSIEICSLPGAPELPIPLGNKEMVCVSNRSRKAVSRAATKLGKKLVARDMGRERFDFTILPAHSSIPFNPNPEFVGRDEELVRLYLECIGDLNKLGRRAVGIVGMGGIGKTQLAVEFAHRFAFAFSSVFWIQAGDPDQWLGALAALARDLIGIEPDEDDGRSEEERYLHALKDCFASNRNDLLVLDNVVDPKCLNDPQYLAGETLLNLGCDILFTTRRRFRLPGVRKVQVGQLSSASAYGLLTSHRAPDTPEEEQHARDICAALGNLPLAIVLAGAYLAEYRSGVSFADYDRNLRRRRLTAVDVAELEESELATRHVASVRTTLRTQWASLKDGNARSLLLLASQFGEAEIIPKARLGVLAAFRDRGEELDPALSRALNRLRDLHLAEEIHTEASAIRLHPLIREFTRDQMAASESIALRAGAARNVRKMYLDFDELERQLQQRGAAEAVVDLRIARDWFGPRARGRRDVQLLHDALRLSTDQLAHDDTQLRPHLYGRLMTQSAAGIVKFLEQLQETAREPWLRCLRPSLEVPGGQLLRTLRGQRGSINSVAIASDGLRMATAGDSGELRLWELDTGRCTAVHKEREWISSMAMSADGKTALAAIGEGGGLSICATVGTSINK